MRARVMNMSLWFVSVLIYLGRHALNDLLLQPCPMVVFRWTLVWHCQDFGLRLLVGSGDMDLAVWLPGPRC